MKIILLLFFYSNLVFSADLQTLIEQKWAEDSLLIMKNKPDVKIKNLSNGLIPIGVCNKKKIFALIPAQIKIEIHGNISDEDKLEVENLYSGGSGGYVHLIIQKDPIANKLIVLFEDVLLEVEEKALKANCPKIGVLVHGSFFNRTGDSPGKAYLVWNKGKYRLQILSKKLNSK